MDANIIITMVFFIVIGLGVSGPLIYVIVAFTFSQYIVVGLVFSFSLV